MLGMFFTACVLFSAAACTPLTRASYATPLPALSPEALTSTASAGTPNADALDGIVVTPQDWAKMHAPATVAETRLVCDVPGAAVDPTALRAVAAMTDELAQKSTHTPTTPKRKSLRSLTVTCDAEHAVVHLDGKPFSAEQIYASVRTLLDGSRVLLIQAIARATGSLLLASVAFDGPPATGSLTTATFAIANVTPYLTADDDLLITPADRTPTFELYLVRRGKVPESGVYLTGPSEASDGQMSIKAARFLVSSP